SATLANQRQDPTARRIGHLKRLLDHVDPPVAILLTEREELCKPLQVLREVGVRLPVAPQQLDLRINLVRIGFGGKLTAHERIESVHARVERAYEVNVLGHSSQVSRLLEPRGDASAAPRAMPLWP